MTIPTLQMLGTRYVWHLSFSLLVLNGSYADTPSNHFSSPLLLIGYPRGTKKRLLMDKEIVSEKLGHVLHTDVVDRYHYYFAIRTNITFEVTKFEANTTHTFTNTNGIATPTVFTASSSKGYRD